MIETKGLEFKLAEADLEWDGRRLSVAKGRAIGAGIALTGEGTFDIAAGTLDFATRFRLTGAITDPEIRVEPLSTFTPGFVRDVFGAGRKSLSPKAKPKEDTDD